MYDRSTIHSWKPIHSGRLGASQSTAFEVKTGGAGMRLET